MTSLSVRCPTRPRPPGDHSGASEQAGAAPVEVGWANDPDRGAYVEGAGDLHLYPHLPESANAKHLLRTMGAGQPSRSSCPSTASGSLFDAVTALAEAYSPPGYRRRRTGAKKRAS